MDLFKKNIGNNMLLKLYKAVSQSEAESFDAKSLIGFLLAEFDKLRLNLNSFYVTGPYPNGGWKTVNGFLGGLNKKDFKNIHHLMVSDSENSMLLNFQNWSHNRTIEVDSDSIVVEMMFDEKLMTSHELASLGNRLHEFLDFEYGYAFTLPKKFSISEGVIKNGFFSYSQKENHEYQKWSKYESATKFGYIRKVYELNFLTQKHLENVELNAVIKSLGRLESQNQLSIWMLTKSEAVHANNRLINSPFLVKNESFNSTEACRVIDSEIMKYTPHQRA
jgi:hypothetical protein